MLSKKTIVLEKLICLLLLREEKVSSSVMTDVSKTQMPLSVKHP